MRRIAVIGLGKAGLPIASVIADSGFNVSGVDIDKRKCDLINRGMNPIPDEQGLDGLIAKHGGKNLIAMAEYKDAGDCNFFIVIVPLFIDENHNPDFAILENAFRNVGKILKKGDCVVLETTIPPLTTETIVKGWLENESGLKFGEFYLAYSPERIMTGYSISRLKEFPKVIGGVDKRSGNIAYDVYKEFIPNLHLVSSSKVAEFIKVIEGCYRDVNIALANELFKITGELDIDFYEAREYANHQYCNIHLPSTGVGGHCIPFYPWFLIKEMERRAKYDHGNLLRTSREINDQMMNYWAERIVLECLRINKALGDVKICVKGITYREGIKELINSMNLALVKLLTEKGLNVYAYDELFIREEIEEMGLRFIEPGDADLVFDCFELVIK
ncbi:nucleotide sugar dehydrogenase [Candidatus Methanoperedens nitratireducens]|uniref:UDP-N-acetyl-D-mannosamine dehydrogenase n=1 Tax=Candidatus Methanoperedens nitratireducens TaxID=1392998 RepID=A0A284VPH5_9EURY|nr:nucleotide sugar dehydrogenase [Candidatus Methanoperedens nitroreducens]SNQ61103.1 Nucleotide sugar dehydrogenase [Candidatus Methanoperedens nitroreducens]